jgi:hypothetical protein
LGNGTFISYTNFLCQNYQLSGWLYLSTSISKLPYGLSTINKGIGIVGTIYEEVKDDFPLFFHLYRRIKKERLN